MLPALRRAFFILLVFVPPVQAADLSPWMADPGGTPHPDYPRGSFFCDVGSSDGDRDAARANAIASVGRQIRSEVRSSAAVDIKRRIDSGGKVVSGSSESSSSVEIESYFARADLIRVVGEEKRRREQFAYACLDRTEAVASLVHDHGPALARFRANLDQAQSAWASNDVAGFTPAYRAAMQAYQVVAVPASIINTLSSGSSEEAAFVGDGVKWLSATRTKAVAGVRMVIDVTGDELTSAQMKSVAEQIQVTLSDLGFIVGGRCDGNSGNVWVMKVTVDTPATYTSFGRYVVKPQVGIALSDCARSDEPLTALVENEEMKAMSQEEGPARDKAVETITAARVAPGLLALMETIFPVEP